MTWQQQDAGRSEVKFAIEWNEKYAPVGWDGSLTKYVLEPSIWRWDKNETTDNSTFNETLSKDPNAGGGSASWTGLKYIGRGNAQNVTPTAKSGWRKLDFFLPRTYTLTSSEQTVTMTISTTSGFGTNVNGYQTIGARAFTFTFKLPAKTEVAKAPEWKPCNVVLKRGNNDAMDLKWTVPLELRDRDEGYTDTAWIFQASKNMATQYTETRLGSTHYTADKIWCRDLGLSSTSHNQEYNRKKYHPLTMDRYLTTVTASVLFYDWTDRHPLSTTTRTTVSFTFRPPKAPEWDEPSYEVATGKVSCSLTAADDEEEYERYDTQYWVTRKDNLGGSYGNEKTLKTETTKDGSATLETDATPEANSLTYDQWIDIRFHAKSRGLAGNSTETVKLYTIAHPPRPEITKITVAGKNSVNGQVTVAFKSNVNSYHPADSFTLQRLSNTAIKTIEMARISQSWQDVQGATDDGTCSGFVDSLVDAIPERNNHVWYRIKAVRANYTEYSDPKQATEIEKIGDPQMDDTVSIVALTPGDDGSALDVVLAWDDLGDDSNGTEVSWSEHVDAWKSTEQPSTYNVPDTWKDSESQVSGKDNSVQMTIRGLTEGVAYYVKARRYLDAGDSVLYADTYATASADAYPVTLVTALKKVYLYAPAYVSTGEGFRVSWTYDSDVEQTSWNLYRYNGDLKVVLYESKDNLGSCAIEKDVLEGLEDITVSVSVSIGNEHVESDPVTVKIVEKPVLKVVTDALLKAQPMRFYVSCDVSSVDLIAKVYSKGVSSGTPDGEVIQTDGEVLWSDKVSPTWYLNEDGLYYTIVVLPEKLPFINGGIYTLEATAVSTLTGLSSDTETMNFEVDWMHLAHLPGPDTYVAPNPSKMSAVIYVDKPDNWQSGDVYDIYRVSNDSTDLVVEGQSYSMEATDNWAPFGKNVALYYRIANRTKDGDMQWADYVYTLYGYQLRIDWGAGESVDLPYNLQMKSQYDKNYEMHSHLDGTTSGHWNPGFKKTDNFTTKLVRIDDNLVANKLRALGEYSGPAFVRTPDGGAYQANVTVSGIDNNYDDLLLGITVKAERHTLTDLYKLQMNDFELVDEQEEDVTEEYTRQQILVWDDQVPAAGNTYALNEEPVGNVFKVELSTSYDNYMEPWLISATYSGRAVTLGEFGSALDTYIEQTRTGTNVQYMLKAYYNIE